jgi:predicted phosphoadenosine phosphosulfate sulfurtransferase
MSSGFWQIKRQAEQYGNGKTVTQRVKNYIQIWEGRCYANGIPDVVQKRLENSGRVPSYRSIAIAILKNDFTLKSLGFAQRETATSSALLSAAKTDDNDKQLRITY